MKAVAFYLARRVGGTVALLAVMSLLIFSLLYAEPGDIARNLLGTRPVSPQALAQVRAEYHLNEPFLAQYWYWLSGALHGNFGTSVQSSIPVAQDISSRAGLTGELIAISLLLAVAGGVPAGFVAGLRHGTATDRAVVAGSIVFVSAPAFALGLVLLYVFGNWLGWFPVYYQASGNRLQELALPALTLALGIGGFLLKITRAAVITESDQDYVTFARARGLSRRQVTGLIARNAWLPVITSLGLAVAYLLASTLLAEQVFSVPGLGTLLDNAVVFKDVPVVQALTLLIAAAIALTALLADIAYGALDPRIRHGMAGQ